MNWTQARTLLAEGVAVARGSWARTSIVVPFAALGEKFESRFALSGEPLNYVLCLPASRTHWIPHTIDLNARDWIAIGKLE